jgi:hypothetical protein
LGPDPEHESPGRLQGADSREDLPDAGDSTLLRNQQTGNSRQVRLYAVQKPEESISGKRPGFSYQHKDRPNVGRLINRSSCFESRYRYAASPLLFPSLIPTVFLTPPPRDISGREPMTGGELAPPHSFPPLSRLLSSHSRKSLGHRAVPIQQTPSTTVFNASPNGPGGSSLFSGINRNPARTLGGDGNSWKTTARRVPTNQY